MVSMTNTEYREYIKRLSPASPMTGDLAKAFLTGGLICAVGQAFLNMFKAFGLENDMASAATSVSLVLIGAVLTGIGLYDRIAKFGGAGTLVPITGFANSIASPALEFKPKALLPGPAQKCS
jgi:stage V sporulation protein AC